MVFAGVTVLCLGLAVSAAVVADQADRALTAPLGAAEAEAVADIAGPGTVAVAARTCGGAVTGSGFVVDGRVVTSRHLAVGAAALTLERDGARTRAAVGGLAERADLALSAPLAAGEGAGPGLVLAPGDPGDGAPVVVVARTGGRLRWLAASARIVEGAAYGAPGPSLLIDRAVGPGWSGGPVLDRAGRVVGVVRAVEGTMDVTLAVPVSQLREWLGSDSYGGAVVGCKGAGTGG